MPGHWLRDAGLWVSIPVVLPAVANETRSPLLPACGAGLSASSNSKIGDPADAGDLSACQVFIEVAQIRLEFRQRFTLRQVVREFLKIAEPHALVLPVHISSSAHGPSLALWEGRTRGSICRGTFCIGLEQSVQSLDQRAAEFFGGFPTARYVTTCADHSVMGGCGAVQSRSTWMVALPVSPAFQEGSPYVIG